MYSQFEIYLQKSGISLKSIKNYKSDISHFMAWSISKLKSIGTYVENLLELAPFLSSSFASDYLASMVNENQPRKTINRRLSTLRHLSRFLVATQALDFDFMADIQNIGEQKLDIKSGLSTHPSISQFKAYLEAEKVSKNTIKNYLSDIKQFMSWLESKNYV